MLLGYCCCYGWQQTPERLNGCLRISTQNSLQVNTFPSQHSVSLSLAFHTCSSLLARIRHLFKTFHKILHSAVEFALSGTLTPTKTKFGHILSFGSSYFFFTKILSKYFHSTFIVKFFLKFQHNFYSSWKISLIYSLFSFS